MITIATLTRYLQFQDKAEQEVERALALARVAYERKELFPVWSQLTATKKQLEKVLGNLSLSISHLSLNGQTDAVFSTGYQNGHADTVCKDTPAKLLADPRSYKRLYQLDKEISHLLIQFAAFYYKLSQSVQTDWVHVSPDRRSGYFCIKHHSFIDSQSAGTDGHFGYMLYAYSISQPSNSELDFEIDTEKQGFFSPPVEERDILDFISKQDFAGSSLLAFRSPAEAMFPLTETLVPFAERELVKRLASLLETH